MSRIWTQCEKVRSLIDSQFGSRLNSITLTPQYMIDLKEDSALKPDLIIIPRTEIYTKAARKYDKTDVSMHIEIRKKTQKGNETSDFEDFLDICEDIKDYLRSPDRHQADNTLGVFSDIVHDPLYSDPHINEKKMLVGVITYTVTVISP